MTEFGQMMIFFSIFTFIISSCIGFLTYILGKENGIRKKNKAYFDNVIKEILSEMYIDEQGNNVLNGGTEEYETKWKYEIGHNDGLQTAIRILKSNINKSI